MKSVTVGNTGVPVSAIGFGAMHLSIEGRPDETQAIDVIHRALELGVNFIDTADAYCTSEEEKHHNERLIHRALAAYAGDTSEVRVATKGGLIRPNGRWERDGSPDHLRRTIRESYQALGGEQPIFLWQHHAPDPDYPVDISLQPALEAVEEGLIRFIGVSNYTVEQLELALSVAEVVSVQNQYSLWNRKPEETGVLAYCEREGLSFLPWGPFGGRRRAKALDKIQVLSEVANERGVSPQQVVLAWLMARSAIILPIPGASRLETLEDSVGALGLELTDEEVQRLDEVSVE